jgi:putative spermidine/putrescine transport system permease protein
MVQIQLPLMIFPLYSVMRNIDRSLALAAQSMGARPGKAFWDVFRPLSMPGVAAGCSLVFVTSLGFFVTPALLGGPNQYLIAQSIEARMTGIVDFNAATAQATVLLLSVVGLMYVLRGPLGLSMDAPQIGRQPYRHRPHWAAPVRDLGYELIERWRGMWLRAGHADGIQKTVDLLSRFWGPALTTLSMVTLVYLVAPMAVVALLAFSGAPYLTFPPPSYSIRWFVAYLSDPDWTQSTVMSLWVATLVASFATALGTLAAFPLVRARRRGSDFLYLLYVSPLVVPHMIIAVALFLILAPAGLIGNPFAFVAAYTVLGLPYGVVIMTAALRAFDPTLEPAAASLGASPARVLWSIVLPLLRPAVASAFLFAFLMAFDDVVVALFLSGPGAVTLAVRMWEDIRLEISPKIAAVSILFLVTALLAALAARFPGRHSRGSAITEDGLPPLEEAGGSGIR